METWKNLVYLTKDPADGAEPWMVDTNTSYFAVNHPLDRGIDLCNIAACDDQGCDKNSIPNTFSGPPP